LTSLLGIADLDDTLYPLSSGIAAACGKNIKGKFSGLFILDATDFL